MYEKEYAVAKEIVEMLENRLGVHFPEGETGFIAVHIHSALTHRRLDEIRAHSRLIGQLVEMVEQGLEIRVDKKSLAYLRLITHLRFAIERILSGEEVSEPDGLTEWLREQFPVCYNLAWKLSKVMERFLGCTVHPAEIAYLTLHLKRLAP
jgi:transcriptional antiterminator/beta-glucoside operon transcriptional antiterminator